MFSDAGASSATVPPTPDRVPIRELRRRARHLATAYYRHNASRRRLANDQLVCRVTVTVQRPGGQRRRFRGEADLNECYQGTGRWLTDTLGALAEVAESRAMRLAFPEFRGLLTEHEPEPEQPVAWAMPPAMARLVQPLRLVGVFGSVS